MVARHHPFAWVIETIAQEQQRLATIADLLGGMGRMMAGPEYARDPRWSSIVENQTAEVFHQMQEYLEVLQTMRIQVLEAA